MRLRKPCQPRVELLEDRCLLSADAVLEWNQLALHAVGQARVSPVVASRALAITQAAVYDAVNAIDRSFEPYHAHVHASRGASLEAAAAQAAHDTLTACSLLKRTPLTQPSPPTWWASRPAGPVRASRWGKKSPGKSSTGGAPTAPARR